MTGDKLTERERLACRLASQVRLLTSIDARRKATGDMTIGAGAERAVVDESLRAIEVDTAKAEAAQGLAEVVLFVTRPDWYEKYFTRRAR